MRSPSLFQKKGLWLKGNTHTHTKNSDGQLTVKEIAVEYGKRGYDFVFLTDHWKRTVPPAGLKTPPLLIPATEIDFTVRGDFHHVVCLGLKREWRRRGFRSLDELIRLGETEGVSLIMAHPYWLGNKSELYLKTLPFLGVEVYNTVCDDAIGKGYSAVHWDDMLVAGKRVFGFAADDFHERRFGLGAGWIMVKARACTERAILAALKGGDFYSSQGPEIRDVTVEPGRASVRCSPVARINFIANRFRGKVVRAPEGKTITRASWTPERYEWDKEGVRYVRIECVDRAGKIAWSNPVFED